MYRRRKGSDPDFPEPRGKVTTTVYVIVLVGKEGQLSVLLGAFLQQ